MSFLVPTDAVPARLGLLLTLALCTTNTLNTVVITSPKSGGSATALVKWIWSCLVFIIMAVVEYSWILASKRYKKEQVNQKSNKKSTNEEQKYQNLDRLMIIVFPPVFLTFSAIFWSSYSQTFDN